MLGIASELLGADSIGVGTNLPVPPSPVAGKFLFRILDQDDVPVAGVALQFNSANYIVKINRGLESTGFDKKVVQGLSDPAGFVFFDKVSSDIVGCYLLELPAGFRDANESQGFYIQAGQTNALKPDDPVGRGCDYIFRVIDGRNNSQQVAWESFLKGVPADETEWSWDTLGRGAAAGPTSRWNRRTDFKLAFWRDPESPLTIKGQRWPELPPSDFPNKNCNWRVTCQPIFGEVSLVRETAGERLSAPVDGYLKEFTFINAFDPSRRMEGSARVRFFWKIGDPVSPRY